MDSSCLSENSTTLTIYSDNETSAKDQTCTSASQENITRSKGIYDAYKALYSHFENEIFEMGESEFLYEIKKLGSNYKALAPQFAFKDNFLLLNAQYPIIKAINKKIKSNNQIENFEVESDIFVKMEPIKKYTKKAKIRSIKMASPKMILEDDY